MTDTTYTTEELKEAMTQLGLSVYHPYVENAAALADLKRNQGFTEEQVRRAVAASVHCPRSQEVKTRGLYWSIENFVSDVISRLREPETVPAPVEGGVYKSPADVLYKRRRSGWLLFGSNQVLTDDQLNYPVSEMEKVL
jgi:hypothetical protein